MGGNADYSDLEKILQLSALFGVTTDYLLKDEIEDEEYTDDANDTNVKRLHFLMRMRLLNGEKLRLFK